MAKKTEIDYQKVESLAATGLSPNVLGMKLGKKGGFGAYQMQHNADFAAAFNRGRETAGLEPYQKRRSPGDREAAALDEDARNVLDAIDTAGKAGSSVGDLEIDTNLSTLSVGRALKILQTNNLIHTRERRNSHGASVTFVAGPGDDPVPAKKAQGAAGTRVTNSHSRELALTLEDARVELLYQRAYGEASPKAPDVLEKIEGQLEHLVAAAGA